MTGGTVNTARRERSLRSQGRLSLSRAHRRARLAREEREKNRAEALGGKNVRCEGRVEQGKDNRCGAQRLREAAHAFLALAGLALGRALLEVTAEWVVRHVLDRHEG